MDTNLLHLATVSFHKLFFHFLKLNLLVRYITFHIIASFYLLFLLPFCKDSPRASIHYYIARTVNDMTHVGISSNHYHTDMMHPDFPGIFPSPDTCV